MISNSEPAKKKRGILGMSGEKRKSNREMPVMSGIALADKADHEIPVDDALHSHDIWESAPGSTRPLMTAPSECDSWSEAGATVLLSRPGGFSEDSSEGSSKKELFEIFEETTIIHTEESL